MPVWSPCSAYYKHEPRANHLWLYAHKRSGCSEAICSHAHVPPWLVCRKTHRYNRLVLSATAIAWSHNIWCQVPNQFRDRCPYLQVGGSALLLGIHSDVSTEFQRTDCLLRHPSLEQRTVSFCPFPGRSRPLWTTSNSLPSSLLELVRLLRGSFLPLTRIGTDPTTSPGVSLTPRQI